MIWFQASSAKNRAKTGHPIGRLKKMPISNDSFSFRKIIGLSGFIPN
jgi:hypothetical protein